MKLISILLLLSIIIAGCSGGQGSNNSMPPQSNIKDIKLATEDQVSLAATYYDANSEKAVILLHMFGMTRQSWKDFATFMQSKGYNVLAVDLRGHGQSLTKNNQKISYISFSDQDFQDMTKDVKAAKEYLVKQGAENISIIGASIGANLAIIYATQDKDIEKIVALSPGLNFKGVKPQDPAKKLTMPVLLVASEDDPYSAMTIRTLDGVMHNQHELKIFKNADHGTKMLSKEPDLKNIIVNFLEK